MYDRDVAILTREMRGNTDTFANGIMFAILSARVQFPRVPEQMTDVRKHGDKSKALWNWKYDAYKYVQDHKLELFASVVCYHAGTKESATCAIRALCQIPGMGIVKAAFVAQMLGHNVACLDVRNIEREGLNPRAYRTDGIKSGAAFERKLHRYVDQTYGQAQHYWDTWCDEVAKDYGSTGDAISWDHVRSIVPAKALRQYSSPTGKAWNDIPF